VKSGFCQSTRTCTDATSCSASDWAQTEYTCPVLDSIIPSRGTADGGTSVNVLSSYLLNGQVISASDVSCEFVGVITVQAQSVTYNSVTCVTPVISPSMCFTIVHLRSSGLMIFLETNRAVEVKIKYRSGYWAPNSVTFNYYGT
jgi:hypothetical protein